MLLFFDCLILMILMEGIVFGVFLRLIVIGVWMVLILVELFWWVFWKVGFCFFVLWVVICENEVVSGFEDEEVGVLKDLLIGLFLFVKFDWVLFFIFKFWLLVWIFFL